MEYLTYRKVYSNYDIIFKVTILLIAI